MGRRLDEALAGARLVGVFTPAIGRANLCDAIMATADGE